MHKKLYSSHRFFKDQGSVVQSIVSFTSSLVVKMLTVLVSTILNSQVSLMKTNIFFSKTTSVFSILNGKSFNDMLMTSLVLNNWAQIFSLFPYSKNECK